MEDKLNIYAKIQKARTMLDKCNLKKTGENKFSKYFYYTLDDLLPDINRIMCEVGLFTRADINDEMGTLTVIDIDKPDDRVMFTMPSSKFEMKGANAIQEIASLQTYVRRYLYILFLEISEADTIDSTEQSEQKAKGSTSAKTDAKKGGKLNDLKPLVVSKAKELSELGKRAEVQTIVKKYHQSGLPNPATLKDDCNFTAILDELNKL